MFTNSIVIRGIVRKQIDLKDPFNVRKGTDENDNSNIQVRQGEDGGLDTDRDAI